jgi:dihydrofolate reductase
MVPALKNSKRKEPTTMRKLIVTTLITVDGVIQAPGGPEEDTSGGFPYGGWQAPYLDEVVGEVLDEQWREPFDLLLGGKTFEIFASYWPYHTEGRSGSGINNATKYVASHTLHSHEWQKSVFLQGDLAEEVRKLKQQDDPAIHVYSSANLIQTQLKHDLIDAFWLKICPITLGTGKRLFAEGTVPAAFEVSKSQASPTGVIVANLERAGEARRGPLENSRPPRQPLHPPRSGLGGRSHDRVRRTRRSPVQQVMTVRSQ